MKRCIVCAAAALFALAGVSQGDLIPGAITGVTGKAFHRGDNNDPGDGSLSRMLDGSGLTVGNPGLPGTWTHNNRWQDNWQGSGSFTGGATPGAWFVADLGQIYIDLDKMWMWNVREVLDRGMKSFSVYYADSPTVTPVTNSAYSFASGGWALLGNYTLPQSTGNNTPFDGLLDLTGIPEARYIGLDIQSNYGSTFRVGLAELEFTTPEPATLTALLLAAGGMGSYLRRRRRAA
ncbi:MAG: hypothetical protein BWX88_02140 [Planctomycetes bacterium ADurb.Bin126]|nr:MAG: hypothetical protein BWX88_02140 [Planctomycetes bacterium ADurb.Bin126]HOD83487.1 PEP-CTERM sorting domain-containing protein [Phycisphaerae bacterium]HQL74244.1 PEP-CTERM sorting domain-containing protein [Phycisphaerae bacterium]